MPRAWPLVTSWFLPLVATWTIAVGVDLNAPLRNWEKRREFPSREDCDSEVKRDKVAAGPVSRYATVDMVRTRIFAARCVSAEICAVTIQRTVNDRPFRALDQVRSYRLQ